MKRHNFTLSFGVWLSLVECLVRDQEAGGSNPLTPTSREPRHALRVTGSLLFSLFATREQL